MKKKLFVHVGTEKTGTTSIQDFIASHQQELKRRGLTFLNAGTESNHHYWLAKALGFRFAPKPVDEAREQKALSDCRKFIAKHPEDDLLLTSEHFDFNPNPENIERFVEFFEGYEINVVLFLRDQISYCQSLYAEHIKWGGVLDFSEFIKRTIKQGRYSYLSKHHCWERFVKNVVVVDYNASRKNLIGAFLDAIGMDEEFSRRSNHSFNSNTTPSMDFLSVVRLLNNGVRKSERRQFYLDLLKLSINKYPELLDRKPFFIPLKFKDVFEEESQNNRRLAESLGENPDSFLSGGIASDDLFKPQDEVIDVESILRRFIFN